MREDIGKLTAGIGYGFLGGAAIGLTAGVITGRLFLWTAIGVAAGLVIGCAIAIAAAAGSRRERGRFVPGGERASGVDTDKPDTLEQ